MIINIEVELTDFERDKFSELLTKTSNVLFARISQLQKDYKLDTLEEAYALYIWSKEIM